ncbi:MAG: hypothetical protein IJ682_08100 [Lachnospiraceae bacterium]|nr:hypothetical protein [Lachnospiraceae bacterium]
MKRFFYAWLVALLLTTVSGDIMIQAGTTAIAATKNTKQSKKKTTQKSTKKNKKKSKKKKKKKKKTETIQSQNPDAGCINNASDILSY